MKPINRIKEDIRKVFGKRQADVLMEFLDIVNETVKAKDFNELKAIVAEIAKGQKELVEAQKRTEQRIEELAEAQKRTEEEVRELARALRRTRTELGGLSKSMSYAFENEAFRMIPKVLKEKYGIEVEKRFVREDIGGKEINIFGRGKKDGRDVLIIDETKLRIEKPDKELKTLLEDFEEKIEAVKKEFGDVEIIKVFVTHFAGKNFLREAEKKGIIVIQSFEW
jgi:predicted  nucleic acid-binding Zn-ribbon protein